MNSISKRFFLFQLMAGIMALSLFSCGSDDNNEDPKDTSAPVIDITKPDDEAQISSTGDLIVEGTLSDNVALSLCIISLEYTDSEASAAMMNDEQLKSTSVDSNGTVTGIDDPWEPESDTISLSGETYDFKSDYEPFGPVPSSFKQGEYTLTIEVKDEADNVATKDILLIFSN